MKKYILNLLIIILFLISIFRIGFIMIIKKDYYKDKLDEINQVVISGRNAPRGRILDRNGKIIVDNKGVKTIVYNKLSGLSNKEEIDIAIKLASILDINIGSNDELKKFYYLCNKDSVDKLVDNKIYKLYEERKIDSKELYSIKLSLISDNMLNTMTDIEKKASNIYNIMNNGYNYQDKIIKKDCTDIEYSKIIENNIIGVRSELSYERIYNYGNVLRDVLGNVGLIPKELLDSYKKLGYSIDDVVGVSYLEKYYEKYLRGEKAKYKINNDNTLTKISDEIIGNDLVLNIDIELQSKIESVLEKEILLAKKSSFTKYYNGSYVIVSDPIDGSIISLVGKSYNNGLFYNNEIGNINKSYTVGSAVKGATISVGYKNNIIDIGTKYNDSCVKLKNKLEKCSWKKLGYINDIDALAYSSNYYQFMIAIGLTGNKYSYNMSLNNLDNAFNVYRNTLSSYGLGVKTGIDLDGEEVGIIGNTISEDLLLNLSIGQYDTYTPIEMTQYINTIANGGKRIELSLMNKIISPKGDVILKNDSKVLNKVDLDKVYMDRIRDGFRSVSLYGTGSYYIDKKYNASSKTGTSESIMDSNLDGFGDTFTTTKTFISYMPSDRPIYSLVIISPNIDYNIGYDHNEYPINVYLAKNISKILFDK